MVRLLDLRSFLNMLTPGIRPLSALTISISLVCAVLNDEGQSTFLRSAPSWFTKRAIKLKTGVHYGTHYGARSKYMEQGSGIINVG